MNIHHQKFHARGLTFPFQLCLMNKEIILADWQQTTDRLKVLIAFFTPDTFNQHPTESGWSAAQIAEHLLKVDRSTCQALKSKTVPTNRPPDQKIALIKDAMEGGTKRVAPEVVKPSGEFCEPQQMVAELTKQREQVKALISELDLTDACKDYKHPSLGTMTRLEWIYFNIYHAERHMRQMEGLKKEADKYQ